ncbi:MAG: hypothetical protein ACWA5W_04365 [Phycisphaerales bacterium]
MTRTPSTHTHSQPSRQSSRQSGSWSQPEPSERIDDAGIIPFADEQHPSTPSISPMDLEETAHDEFGAHDSPPPRLSAVDQALGLQKINASTRRTGFSCPCCQHSVSRAMRVRVAGKHPTQSRWIALCAVCAASMLASVPGTIVGGMVRPTRRRRPIQNQATGQPASHPRRNTRYRRAG